MTSIFVETNSESVVFNELVNHSQQCFGAGSWSWRPSPLPSSFICRGLEGLQTGMSWQIGQLRSSGVIDLKKNSLLPRTRALVSLQSAISAIQSVDKMLNQRDISHHIFTGDPLSSCQGSFRKCTQSGQSLFDFSRVPCSTKCLFSLQFRQIRLIEIRL